MMLEVSLVMLRWMLTWPSKVVDLRFAALGQITHRFVGLPSDFLHECPSDGQAPLQSYRSSGQFPVIEMREPAGASRWAGLSGSKVSCKS